MSIDVRPDELTTEHPDDTEAFACPTCGEPVEVEWRDWLDSTHGQASWSRSAAPTGTGS